MYYNLAKIKLGLSKKIYLGNIKAKRDWGYAKDYVEAMWLMLQAESPEEYVIATGKNYSVQEFGEKSFSVLGLDFNDYVEVKEELERPVDVRNLIGDPSKAIKNLGWNPNKTSIDDLINMMVTSDYDLVKRQKGNIYINDIESIQEFPHFKQ